MYKDLMQQIMHQKVQHNVQQKFQQNVHNNYIAQLIKRVVFTKLVECLCQQLEYLIGDVNFVFRNKNTQKFKFSVNFIVQHVCTSLCSFVQCCEFCCAVLFKDEEQYISFCNKS